MTEKELLRSLKELKTNIQPETDWLKANRDSLYSQISNSGAQELSAWSSFVISLRSVLRGVSVPAAALGSLVLLLFVSMVYGHLLLATTKPTDSFYIARELSERAKLSTVRDSKERDQLAGKFAMTNAQDIAVVLSDPQFTDETKRDELTGKLTKEIDTIKRVAATWEKPAATPEAVTPNQTLALNSEKPATDDDVFSANLDKVSDGISVSSVSSETATPTPSTTKIIEEAEALFKDKKYKEASELLGTLFNKNSEVKTGESVTP